jgi:hypothetical protein
MTNQNKAKGKIDAVWDTRLLRFTGFTTPESQNLREGNWRKWWETIAGSLPENRIENPRAGFNVDSGQFENGQLKVEVRQNRIDILFENIASPEAGLSTLGEFTDVCEKFKRNIVQKLLGNADNIPTFSRIAFGGLLFSPKDTIEDAFALLSDYITCIDFERVSKNIDFEYKSNRQRKYTFRDLPILINRLTKWNATVIQIFLLESTMKEPKINEVPACTLEIDINTHISNDINFDRMGTEEIFNALVEMGMEISTEGDIP